MATDSPFEDQIKQALWTEDVDTILRLCDDSSKRTSILHFKKDGKLLVHFAAQFGSVILLEKLRGLGFDLKVVSDDTYGYHYGCSSTTLHIACKHGNIEVVEYLLKTVPDITFNSAATVQLGQSRNYRNEFYYAAQSGNTEVVKCLQTLGKLDINKILPNNQTVLSICVAERNLESAKILCECGANVNLGKFDRGLKPIQYLAEKQGSSETMKVLLNFGANVNEPWVKIARRSCLRQSPLFMALKHGIEGNAKTLIECGADVSFVGQTSNTDMGSIGCFSLAAKRCPELISDFLKYGANPNERHNGKSVLMTVMDDDYASTSTIQALVEAGADVNQRINGKTLIQCCQNYETLRAFIEGGVSVKLIESEHKMYTISLALDCIYGRSDAKTISDLLSKGANPNLTPHDKDPPLIVATMKNLREDLEYLIKGGAKLDAVSRDGDTAIVVCCEKASQNYYPTLSVLIESGASLNVASQKGEYPLEILSQRIKDVKHSGFNQLMGVLLAYQSKDNGEIENCVTKMLTKGANPNITKEGRNSPLIIAVQKQSENLVQILLNAGADILHVGENKRTALDLCFCQDTLSIRDLIIKALVENPKCYSTSDTIGSFGTYLLDVLIENDVEDAILESAISKGADPNRVTPGKDSPLMKAIKRGSYKISCGLIEAGANVTYANADGTNAFDMFSEICKTLQDNPYAHKRHLFRSKRFYSRKSKTSEDNDEDNWADSMKNLLRCFMVSGIEVNKRTKNGIYPLQVPIWLNSVEMTKWALEHEADVNIVDDLTNAPLTIALGNGHIDIVQILLDYKAKVNYTGHGMSETEIQIKESSKSECNDIDMEDPLLTKVILGNTNKEEVLVKMLIQAGADPNTVINGVDSPLLHAIRKRDLEIVKILLESGANVKHVGWNSYTALHVYFQPDRHNIYSFKHFLKTGLEMRGNNGPSQILQLLLRAEAPLHSMSDSKELPIHFAMHVCSQIKDEGIEEDICLMLDYFKDVNMPDKNGNTPLIIACGSCSFDIINTIILHGADVCYRGKDGLTACQAHMDSSIFDKKVVSLLIKHRADINMINDTGETALIRFIKRGRQKVSLENVSFLLEIGADPNITREGCNSALTEALSLNLFSLLPCLLNAKSNVNHVGKNGATALQIILGKVGTVTDNRFEDEDFLDEEYDYPTRKIVRNRRSDIYSFEDEDLSDNWYDSSAKINVKHRRTVGTVTDNRFEDEDFSDEEYDYPTRKIVRNRRTDLHSFEDDDLSDNWYDSSAKINVKHRTTVCTVVTQLLSAGADVNFVSKDGESPLYMLLKIHDTTLVDAVLRLFIRNRADPNKGEEVPLVLAAQQKRQISLKMLLEAGADVDKSNINGETALIASLRAFSKCPDDKATATVEILLESGALVNLKDGSGNTPLSLPLITGTCISDIKIFYLQDFCRKKMISILLEKGACPNSQLEGEDSPLMVAVDNSLTECVEHLLESGANPNHVGKEGNTALHKYFSGTDQTLRSQWTRRPDEKRLLEKQRLKIIDLLLSKGARVNMDEDGHDSPLLLSIQYEDIDALLALLSHVTAKPNIYHKGRDNLNAFEKSLRSESYNGLKVFGILLQHETPIKDNIAQLFNLLWEYCKAHEALDTTLLENVCMDLLSTYTDIEVNLTKNNEDSPLIYFCRMQCNESIKMLLARKADVNHIGTRGKTVLYTLIDMSEIDTCKFKELVETIFSAQPNVDTKDETGKSPLETCITMYNRHYGYHLNPANIGLLIQHMLDTGATSSSCDLDKVLEQAAKNGDFKTMESLCRHGANIHMTDYSGNTILHLCWSKSLDGAVQFLEYYLKEVGCLNKIVRNGKSPLLVLLENCKRQTDRNEKTEDQIANIANFFMKNTTTEILDSDGNSPLHFAAESGLIKTIDVLLSAGADASRQNKQGRTALHSCLENPKSNIVEVVSKLVESGKASDQLEISSKTPLYLATSLCKPYYSLDKDMLKLQPRVVEVLLKSGADPNSQNRSYIPLHSAVTVGDVDTVSLLLEKGALANATNAKGQSAMHVLFGDTIDQIKDCEMALLQLLLGKGTDVNATDEEGKSALIVAVKHYASREQRIRSIPCRSTDPSAYNAIAELICHGAMVNLVDKEGDTALTMFCKNGSSIGIGMTLLQAGADPSVGNCLQSVLENSKLRDDQDFLLELLKKGANPNIHSGYGFNNLIEVIQKEETQLVEAFLRHGAAVNCVHYNGKSALHYACDIAKPKIRNVIIPLLIKYGANLNLMSQDSMRPLDVLVDRIIRDVSELQIINDGMYSHPYMQLDLSSFNQLIRSGSDLAPIADKRKVYSRVFGGIRQIPGSTKPSLFLSLIQNGLFTAAYYLLQCGWECEKDKCLDNFDITKLDLSTIKVKYEIYNRIDIEEAKAEFWNIFENSRKVTKPLSTLCRKSIRKQLVFLSYGSDITSKISKLPVPLKIQRFLDLTECVQDDEIILLEEKTRPPPRNPRAFNVMQSMYTGIRAPSLFMFSNNGSDDD